MTPHHHRLSDVTPPPTAKTADAVGVSDRPGRRRGATTPYRAILDMTPDATVVHDRDGRITFVNRQTERLFGYPRAELLGQPVEQLIPARLQALHRQHLIDYTAAPDTRLMGATLQVLGRRRDGSEFPLEVTLSHLTAGGDVLLISTIRDVSEVQRVQAAHAALETRNRELLLLQALTETTLSSSALHDVLPTLLARVQEVLGVDNVAILLLDPEGQTLRLRASRGLEEAVVEQVHIPVGQGFAGTIAATRAPLIAEDLSTFPAVNPFLREHLRSAAGVPLLVADRLLGVLHIDTIQPHHFTVSEMQVLQHVAERVTLALDRAQAHEAAQAARAEAERQAAELDRIFEAVADGVAVYDRQGREVRTNAALHRLLGLAPPEYAQLSLPERMALFAARDEQGRPLTPDEGPLPRALAGAIVAGTESMDLRSRTFDGREVELNISAAPVRNRIGQLEGVVCVFRDQTERNQLARERAAQAEQLDRVFEGMGDGVFVYDAHGQVVRTNRAARHILGLDAAPPDFYHLPVAERLALYAPREAQDGHLLPPDDLLVTRVLRGEVPGLMQTQDLRMRALDGRELETSATVAPLHDREGRLVGAVTMLRDDTERKRLEREQEAARLREQAVAVRAEAADELNQRMEQFLATASHELRNPVTTVLGSVQLAQRRARGLATAVASAGVAARAPYAGLVSTLERANQALHRLDRLIGRLFDLTQVQLGQLELRLAPHNLTALVRAAVAAQRAVIPERTIHLQVPTGRLVPVLADADRLDQVLTNYLTNAVKYAPPDQPIDVRLAVEEGKQARVTVRDHGPGLPLEEQGPIWELHHRAPGVVAQSGQRGSLGLGLYLCKTLVERHGGQVGLDSVPGQGATFWFTLPLATAGTATS